MTSSYQYLPYTAQIEWVCPVCPREALIDIRDDGVMFVPKHETITPPLDGAEWQAVHASCAEGCGWGPGVTIPLSELQTYGALLRWTAILMRNHSWIAQTNWPEMLRHVLYQPSTASGTIRVSTADIPKW